MTMQLTWVRDQRPVWDEDKQRVIGGAPPGALDLAYKPGAELPGDWWAARDDEGNVVGYGWLDSTWGGDAEVLLAVDPGCQRRGVGSYILRRLESEAGSRGLNYVYNTVRPTHPDREGLHDWLAARGYKGGTADTALRKRTYAAIPEEPPARSQPTPGAATLEGAMPPGHEESGGYVDVDEHQY